MDQNRGSGLYPPSSNLSGHAALLLSASPTIITSPLQNNTNNPQASSSNTTNQQMHVRRLSSTTPLVTASNLDNDTCTNREVPSNINFEDSFINFKKPQNEIFKKLDGKIQKIVAAHSNLNKLYALNDFSSLGAKRPFELPPQLPPPPPWVPKAGSDYGCNRWTEEAIDRLTSSQPDHVPSSSMFDSNELSGIAPNRNMSQDARLQPRGLMGDNKSPSLTIDSAISKLHRRRDQKSQPPEGRISGPADSISNRPSFSSPTSPPLKKVRSGISGPWPDSGRPGSSLLSKPTQKMTPAEFSLLTKKIKETLEADALSRFARRRELNRTDKISMEEKMRYKNEIYATLSKTCASANSFTSDPTKSAPVSLQRNLLKLPKARFDSMTPEDRNKFYHDELVARIKQEIAYVSRDMNINSPTGRTNNSDAHVQISRKCSPQALFNTIRRETSLLLSKQDPQSNFKKSASLLRAPLQSFLDRPHNAQNGNWNRPPAMPRLHSVKVVIPPTEYYQPLNTEGVNENVDGNEDTKDSKKLSLTYQLIKNKIKSFEESNRITIGRKKRLGALNLSDIIQFKRQPQKTLDKIVDRLQAKRTGSPMENDSTAGSLRASVQQQIINSTANLLQSSRNQPPLSGPIPIPIFRTSLAQSNSRIVNMKSRKSKKTHVFGLRLSNYSERDSQPTTREKITIEQFAKSLNLVRTNDVSLQRHQEQLLQSESRWRIPVTSRPLRLRRIRGERLPLMPASASYKATRRAGLQ